MMTKWIGDSWEELLKNNNMIERSFKNCGISVAADGSESLWRIWRITG